MITGHQVLTIQNYHCIVWHVEDRLIIQIAGAARAGKSEVAKHLAEEYDFSVVLISDIIRAYADMREIILAQRDSYLRAFKHMKADLGSDIVASTVLEADGRRICVDGNRVPADVERLRQVGAKLLALDCPVEVRFERAQRLQSPLDRRSLEEFMADDAAESSSRNPELQNLRAVIGMADFRVDSSRSLDQVTQDIDRIVALLVD